MSRANTRFGDIDRGRLASKSHSDARDRSLRRSHDVVLEEWCFLVVAVAVVVARLDFESALITTGWMAMSRTNT